ncbi:thiamine-phosphate kinase [Sulfurirhabdus autotrophica]|uniref:Thiamine-monophosphate kinase n=1 Tax=Sulfurirhabdus autotrophica TaxID=1706046 RepID=A0A4R3Y4V5_9PROT|nr:thiamine-phosphate kinase [Sulfurirhabdus autotrophica]TCV85434.1 thiamine-phosphate kinase [Sulfurirhabdus autotrophica]
MASEFDLIHRYFTRPAPSAILGVGDDAALIQPSPGMVLAVAADMLVAGRHFSYSDKAETVGHKSLAVNLSDMAAMGATPRWALLSLAIKDADEAWLQGFSEGFFALAQQFGVELIGGDTTSGPLNLSVQIMGEVPPGQALRRDGAQVGDEIWVSGTLGDAALGLANMQQRLVLTPAEAVACMAALHMPQPRVTLGLALRGMATAAIDISDGLLADLGHILERSNVAAEIEFDRLPASEIMRHHIENATAQQCLLAGGDDYELCFTVPAALHQKVSALSKKLDLPLTCIGSIKAGNELTLLKAGKYMLFTVKGFDHFA